MHRTAAGGDQNMIGGDLLAVHFDGVGVDKASEAFNHVDVVFAQHGFIRGVDAIDIGAAVFHQRLPVELVHGGIEAVVRAVVMDRFRDLRRMPHNFFRNAADVNAGAAQLFRFDQGAFLAIHRRTVNGGDTAAAAADGEVIIMSGH